MKEISKTSKAVMMAVLLSAIALGGCSRRSPATDQAQSGTAGTGGATSSGSSATDTTTTSRAGTSNAAPSGSTSSSGSSDTSGTSGSSGSSSDMSGSAKSAANQAGGAIDDSVITTKVKTALLGDSDIKSLDISVETNKGDVMLSGFVNNQTQIDRAMKIARGVQGVKAVENKLAIKKG